MSSVSRSVGRPVSRSVLAGQLNNLASIIKSIFATGEQGFAYDPNDLTTLYQDAAGTVPVTAAGQPVGLMLDKSNGLVLGNEISTNGDFLNGKTGWTDNVGVSTVSNGVLTLTNPVAPPTGYVYQSINTVVGKYYKASVEVTFGAIAALSSAATILGLAPSTTGTSSVIFKAVGTTSMIRLYGMSNAVSTFKNVSVKELAGNHAYQTVSAMRPLLVATPQRLDYDAVDDKLTTNLPAQLTGCTVIRSVPNVGTQILTGQTIPATYEDNKDHCGLIVINRALTPSETSAIAAEFNKRAGV